MSDTDPFGMTPEEHHDERMRRADEKVASILAEVDLSLIPPSSWHKRKMLAFDLETTGVNVDEARIVTASILEIFGNPFDQDKVVTREWLVNPGIPIPPYSTSFHGVTDEKAQLEGISPRKALEEVIRILRTEMHKGHAVIGFNVSYDFTVLHREALRHGIDPITEEEILVVDPAVIDNATDKYRGGKRKLTDVAAVYGISSFDAHNSTADCLATAQIAYRMAETYVSDIKLPVETLMSWQRIWRKKWAEEKDEYFISVGRKGGFNPHMGIQPSA